MVSTKSILLTGATGLLGRHLTSALLKEGYIIFATYRDTSKTYVHTNLNWLTLEELFSKKEKLKIDYIIHAAGLVSYKSEDKDLLFEINQKLTQQLGLWALDNQVQNFIYISSIATIGKKENSNVLSEESIWDDGNFASQYALSKKGGENIIKSLGKKGLNHLILNPSVIIGSSPLHNSSSQLFQYVIDEKPFYTGGVINYIDVRDLVKIIIACLEKKVTNEQFIINGGHITYKQFFQALAVALGKRAPYIRIPRAAVLIGARIEHLWSKINNKEALLSKDSAKTAGNKYVYSSDKIVEQMNIPFTPFEETVSNTVKMMRKEGFIKL